LPTVILVHGSGGAGAREAGWAEHLNKLGIATFTLDSFTGRGITNTGENQALLPRLAMVFDAYRALDLLAKHPRIDPSRIAIMGFSRGGQATLYSSLKRFRRLQGSAGVEFAAYLPFYAPCSTTYVDDIDVSDKPIRLFHGTADDYNPVTRCRPYVERLRAAGKNVQIFEYPGAHHVFDNPLGGPPRHSPRSQTVRHCTLQESTGGQIINAKTNQPFTYDDPCVERGVTMGYDADAHAKAVSDVTEFLKATFNLK
jgi:dienelactone hydrolase